MKKELLAATAIGSIALCGSTQSWAQTYNWTGFYVGGLFGYGTVDPHAVRSTPVGAPTAELSFPGNVPTFNPALPFAALSTGPFSALPSPVLSSNGLMGGGTLGYNRQVNHVVLGIETDFASFITRSGNSVSQQNITVNGARTTAVSVSAGTDWLYTLRGRVGYAQDRLLIFGTAGLALGQTQLAGNFGVNENSLASTFVPTGFLPGKGTTTTTANSAQSNSSGAGQSLRAGYIVGGGIEYAVTDHVTVKLEGLYYDLGHAQAQLNGSGRFATTTTVTTNNGFGGITTTNAQTAGASSVQPLRIRYHFNGSIGRIGVNYKF